MKMKLIYFLSLLVFLVGCSQNGALSSSSEVNKVNIVPPTEHKSKSIQLVRTTDKKMALTFNGLAEENTMHKILDELDTVNVKATFFVPGNRLAEDPSLVEEIIERGHTVHNNTLNHALMDQYSYEQTFLEMELANKVFREKLDFQPKYIRSRTGDSTLNMELAAAQLGMKVIGYTINPQDRNMQSADEIANYVDKFSTRGGIIQLNTYINPSVVDSIALIHQNASEKGFKLTTMEDLISSSTTNKTAEELLGTDTLSLNLHYENVEPNLFYSKKTDKKEVALTFDDYAGDATTSAILDILKQYHIKSTFFLIGRAAELNPNLAKLIIDDGHEVASHSFNHLDVTQMDPAALQEDIIMADQALAEAIQDIPLRYFRPSQGIIDEESAKVITATGIDVIAMYDVASFDWDTSLSAQDIYQRVMERTKPGSVIVMHVLDGKNNIEALPLIIEDLLNQGYEFKMMSEWVSETISVKED
ncbi:MAG TPA: polysaccharide deacetylase family protein [Ureibacillus sp.]|nr:polysaccharide deacetylase family protein [Ureibacillus sp.]